MNCWFGSNFLECKVILSFWCNGMVEICKGYICIYINIVLVLI